ncbi:restriction endonuclease subunit S [Streptomyces sp. NL15-2K]|uniref:restriction endonuclease subunit S n=1 Tax=Streptomyces sp. NL15-2K TaxID=376149 RepID=UPI000F58772A|nr:MULTISPECIES: restriction endonuclease subunit S [Actinomycetes]WKX10028.1 restriction endonuclease subunit S [Kutzneria buriramensis]
MTTPAATEVALKWVLTLRSGTSCSERTEDGAFPVMGAAGPIGRTSRANTRSGSTLIGRVGTVGAINLAREECWASDNVIVASPGPTLESTYTYYLLMSARLPELASKTAQPLLTASAVAGLRFPIPPLEEQRRIAGFLDAETARIDALTRTYVKLRELVSERSQRVIDSEIEQHRNLTPFRYLVRFREGPGIMAVDFHDEGIPLIRISGLQRGEVTLNGCNYLDPEKAARQWSQFRLKLGDRLISGSATMGGVSVVKDPSVVGAIPYTGLIILRPARQDVEMKYVEAFLRSSLFSRQIDVLKTGATMQHFGPTHLSQIQAPMPSHHEQLRIVGNVQAALAHADRCDDLVDRQLALLTERRQSLIAAAVTGQFDVSTAGGRNVTDGVSA